MLNPSYFLLVQGYGSRLMKVPKQPFLDRPSSSLLPIHGPSNKNTHAAKCCWAPASLPFPTKCQHDSRSTACSQAWFQQSKRSPWDFATYLTMVAEDKPKWWQNHLPLLFMGNKEKRKGKGKERNNGTLLPLPLFFTWNGGENAILFSKPQPTHSNRSAKTPPPPQRVACEKDGERLWQDYLNSLQMCECHTTGHHSYVHMMSRRTAPDPPVQCL